MTTASEAAASMTSDSVIPPTPVWMTSTWISCWGSLAISSSKASSEPETSALSTSASSLASPSCTRLKTSSKDTLRPERRASISVFSRCARSAAARRPGLAPRRARAGELGGAAVVLDRAERLARLGNAVEAEDLDRLAGQGLLALRSRVVRHGTHLAPVRSGDQRIAHGQRAALDQQGDDGATARVELGLDDDAGCVRVGVGLKLLEIGDDLDRLEQVLEAVPRLGRDVDELGVAAPVGGLQAELGHLGAHARRVGALLVDLVDRDEHRDLRGLGVVHGLARLRLDAVVGGDHDHRDVRHLGAAGAHGGERLMARRVEEGDLTVAVVDLVGADVLGDPAGLALGDA